MGGGGGPWSSENYGFEPGTQSISDCRPDPFSLAVESGAQRQFLLSPEPVF